MYLLGIDQGTSGSRALILDGSGRVCGYGYRALPRLYPQTGWVEQDPDVVAQGVAEAITEALHKAAVSPHQIIACGIAGQRNTDFVWSASTGRPLANAITWQDLRTMPMLAELAQWEHSAEWRERLGYFPGPYSSAVHLAWRFQHQPAVRAAAESGDLRIGFSANWLLAALGHANGHVMDYGLVQAMGLYDFRAEEYWAEWLAHLGIPRAPLPNPVPNLHDFGTLTIAGANGETAAVPVRLMMGNEQAALFGHECRTAGTAECTHGTASFVNVFLGNHAPRSEKLNIYYAWHLGDQHTYCAEADTCVTGAAVRWMREEARLFDHDYEVDELAGSVPDAGGVVFVPAFTGLNVPYNDPTARGTIWGLTLGSSRAHIIRAFLEALGYQMRAILETIEQELGIHIAQLNVGGGVSASDVACQVQADLTGLPITRPAFTELSARTAALLAGLAAGVWPDVAALPPLPPESTHFAPQLPAPTRDAGYAVWHTAVERARG